MNVNYLVGILNHLKLGSLASNCWFPKAMRFVLSEFKSKNFKHQWCSLQLDNHVSWKKIEAKCSQHKIVLNSFLEQRVSPVCKY